MRFRTLPALRASARLCCRPVSVKGLASVAILLIPTIWALVAVAALVTRIPLSLLTNFWAEDGAFFYSQAYNLGGLHALTIPYAGYLHTIPRLEAGVAVNMPVVYGPLMASAVALAFDVLPGAFFLSSRCSHLAPLSVRLILSTVSVVLPDTFELNGNLANIQWHLVLFGLLLLVGQPPRTLFGHCIDILGLLLVGMSGPFGLLLSPIALGLWWFQGRPRWLLSRLASLVATAVVQGTVILIYRNQRPPLNTRMSWDSVVRVFDRPLLTPLIGGDTYRGWHGQPWWQSEWLPVVVLGVGAAVIAYGALRGPTPLRALYVVAAGILAMTLASPGAVTLADLGAGAGGMRYFYVPAVAWIITLVWLALRADWRWLRVLPILVLGYALLVAVPVDWRYPHLAPTRFAVVARQFDQAPRGTQMALPEEPGPPWAVNLIKR